MVLLISSCNNTNQLNERILLENKTEAFQFLSTYHHQLHIMIGEEEGNGELAYKEFLNALMYNDNNELLAVAKLSKPLEKSYSKEAIIKVKLDF